MLEVESVDSIRGPGNRAHTQTPSRKLVGRVGGYICYSTIRNSDDDDDGDDDDDDE